VSGRTRLYRVPRDRSQYKSGNASWSWQAYSSKARSIRHCAEYQELFIVVVSASDFTVEICTASSPWMDDKPEYKYGPDLLALNLMAMSAYVLRNPETGKEGFAHNRAGLAASLRGYEAVLKQEPAAHSKALDELLLLEKQGQLDDWFRARYAKKCTKK